MHRVQELGYGVDVLFPDHGPASCLVWGGVFKVQSLGLRFWIVKYSVWGLEFKVHQSRFRISVSEPPFRNPPIHKISKCGPTCVAASAGHTSGCEGMFGPFRFKHILPYL